MVVPGFVDIMPTLYPHRDYRRPRRISLGFPCALAALRLRITGWAVPEEYVEDAVYRGLE